MAGLMSIGGIVSGLQTDSIIASLQQIALAPVTRMETQQSTLAAKSQAWNTANTRLLAIKTAANSLSSLAQQSNVTATSSEATVGVLTSASAVAGDYSFTVESVAAYHQLATQGYSTKDTSLGAGAVTLSANDKSMTIPADDLTLEGLRDAINEQTTVGVKAIIISDGAETPTYRLMLTSKTLGSDGKVTMTSTLPAETQPVLKEIQAASDSVLKFGSGDNAFTVSRSSTTLDDVISGVSIYLKPESMGKSATLHVTSDGSSIKNAVKSFINQYNAYVDFVTQQNAYDKDTGESGTLFGENILQQVRSDIVSTFLNPINGLPSTMNSVSQVGVKSGSDGKLTLDELALNDALTKDLLAVQRLFTTTANGANKNVSYVASTNDTKANAAGYAVTVTQAATQSRLTLATVLPSSTTNAESLSLNGVTVAITAGMTTEQIVKAINAQTSDTGVTASLTGADGTGSGSYLTLTEKEYGSGNHVTLVSDMDGAGYLGIGTTELSDTSPGVNTGVAGVDIQGTINGQTTTGSGQLLTSTTGDSKGLQLLISNGVTGDLGTVTFTRGIGSMIETILTSLTDSANGSIKYAQDTIAKQQETLTEAITRAEESAAREVERVRAQFNAMEVALGKLQNQSAQLSSLISGLSTSSSSSSA